MQSLMLILLAIASVWDAYTTFYGAGIILTSGPIPEDSGLTIQFIVRAITTLLCIGLLFSTRTIMETDLVSSLGMMLRVFWILAVIFSLYTTFLGHEMLMLSGLANTEQFFFLAGITLLVSGSPVLFSLLFHEI